MTFLSDDVWAALSDSGELQYIKDPQLLSDISNAYTSIRKLKGLAEKYYRLTVQPALIEPIMRDHILKLIEEGSPNVLNEVKNITSKIEKEYKLLNN